MRGQGRPIGLLIAWLFECHSLENATLHIGTPVAAYEDRVKAREVFMALPGANQFIEKERGGESIAALVARTFEPYHIP